MTDSTITIKDASLSVKNRRIIDEGGAGITPYNAEHPDQRAALLTSLTAITTALNSVAVTGPLTNAQLRAAPAPVYTPGGHFTISASFTRPADTTAYAVGDRVADSTSAATVLEFTNVMRATGEAARIERIRLRKTGATLTNAAFRVHLFRTLPTVNVNDNGVFNTSGTLALADIAGYIGSVDITMDMAATAGARGVGVPTVGTGITCEAAGTTDHETSIWAVVEARGAYTPVSAEAFTMTLEASRS